ncbi:ABC transporter permease [Paenibacillus sp. N4]|uniref:nickel ABC transporter permease n=1 Tax=Paenibacillus vietnamensis TaxID=2590547 RepID=UPI001CD12CBA|nr:nickel ABC transporter permease [Paenibacillus vietnamensis]MCA0756635.1 ABC transporter permease [Paenibacillus vietnamensis]
MLVLVRRRLLQLVIVLFGLSVITFVLMKLAPGDPVLSILRIDEVAVTQADEEAVREKLGFNKPFLLQYGEWLLRVLKLDLGSSYVNGTPVLTLLSSRLPLTLQLTAGAIVVMLALAIPLGLLAARYPGRWPDHLCRIFALLGASIPNFLLGLLLIYFLSYRLGWLPTMGTGGIRHMILPSVTLGFALAAVYSRLLRSGLLDSLAQPYIRAARARGIAGWRVVLLHALRPALLPMLAVFGMSLGSMLAGSVVVEMLYAWPGIGSLAVDAVFQRDYPVIQGYVLLTGAFVIIVNLVVDVCYGLLDPRISFGKGDLQ